MSIERRRLFQTAGLAAAAAAAATLPATAAETLPEVKWRLTSGFPKTLDLLNGGADVFAAIVSEATEGKFQIQTFPPGEITSSLQALEAVQNGTVEACHTSLDYSWGKAPTFAIASAIPFGMNARQQSAWLYHGAGNELINEFLQEYNCYALPAGNTGCQMGGWFRAELKSVADLKGLKLRTGGLAGKVLQRLGVEPAPLASSELLSALEKGTLDAAQWVGPYDDERLGLSKVAPYYYYPGWWKGGSTVHLAFNLAKWNELPKPYRAVLSAAAALTHTDMLARYDAANPAAVKTLVNRGAKLRPFPQDVLEAAYRASVDLYAEIAEADPAFKKMLEATVAFRNDQYLWWQVAEYTYDNFMIRERAKA
jgi:TRAP-type mannitol/chloroaromatic compound transport system substrate-binding protein